MLEAGRVVRSVAGHDKDSFYVVVRAEKERVYIADGRARKLAKPKAKNARHVRGADTVLDLEALGTDKKLRQALKDFNETH